MGRLWKGAYGKAVICSLITCNKTCSTGNNSKMRQQWSKRGREGGLRELISKTFLQCHIQIGMHEIFSSACSRAPPMLDDRERL